MTRILETYRGFEIQRDNSVRGAVTWTHPEYEGPGDARHGWGWTLEDVKAAVDEHLDDAERPILERCGSCPELTTKRDAYHNPQCSRHGGRS